MGYTVADPDGFLYACVGRYSESLVLFDQVLLADPENTGALLGKAAALDSMGRFADALAVIG